MFTDLGLDGDDAHSFMAEFAERYGVDMMSFQWLRYFSDEGFDLLSPALVMVARLASRRFARRWDAACDAEREITIAHLVQVAQAKVWTDPGPEHRKRREGCIMRTLSVLIALALCLLVATGVLACYGYLNGEIGDVNVISLAGLVGATVFPIVLAIVSWRNIRRKLATV